VTLVPPENPLHDDWYDRLLLLSGYAFKRLRLRRIAAETKGPSVAHKKTPVEAGVYFVDWQAAE
jgi:hypothetical protein